MVGSKVIGLFLILLFFVPSISTAQKTKSQLESEKKENLKKIAEAERILEETASQKEVTLGQLQALNQQIKARQSLINSIASEIKILDGEISDLSIVVNALQNDLKNLKQEYADQIYASYKSNKGNSRLTFLFSAKSFNQLIQRMKYMEQYADARRLQAEQIDEVTKELSTQRSQVQAKRSEQQRLLNQQVRESRKLANSKQKQSALIAQLSKKERQLQKEVNDRKRAIEKLNTLIASIVESEVEKSRTVSTAVSASEAELSRLFESNKNKMDWPVSSGFISSKFGKQQHPVLKRITIINDGVGIQTEKDTKVKTVFEGVVSTIAAIESMNNIVIVRHGDYYTVYARLKTVNVQKGQRVRRDDIIGEVYTNKDGISELEFQVWKERTKLDPEKWLALK
ncbi:MAG: peptidoglycan DD-metalloendopeptidase family protein [Cyclobacteriaceae bacterium]